MSRILVSGSLMETLWRLEEVRLGFRAGSQVDVDDAIDWVLSRQGLEGSYCELFLPTPEDLKQGLQLPTGERMHTIAATKHILGEEALRALLLWKRDRTLEVKHALKGFESILERGGKTGRYCCHTCTIAFLRTLETTTIGEKDEIVQKGLDIIRRAHTPDGRWNGFPYYYTLFTLTEIEQPEAKSELEYTSKTAEKLLKRYQGKNRTDRFRKQALEAALNRHRLSRPRSEK